MGKFASSFFNDELKKNKKIKKTPDKGLKRLTLNFGAYQNNTLAAHANIFFP